MLDVAPVLVLSLLPEATDYKLALLLCLDSCLIVFLHLRVSQFYLVLKISKHVHLLLYDVNLLLSLLVLLHDT